MKNKKQKTREEGKGETHPYNLILQKEKFEEIRKEANQLGISISNLLRLKIENSPNFISKNKAKLKEDVDND